MALPVYQEIFSIQSQCEFPDQLLKSAVKSLSTVSLGPSVEEQSTAAKTIKSSTRPKSIESETNSGVDWRALFDEACAALGLFVMAPLFVMIAIAIKLDDGGPVFYSHIRVGRKFQKFNLYKFRSMIHSTTEGSTVTAPQDSRVTRVGGFLRRFKLDELPQLVNVLKGEMQLVGSRPQMDKFVEIFFEEYEELLQTRPGITDLASLIFRDEAKFFYQGSIEEQYVKRIMPIKLEMSLKYARTRTFFSDLDIIFRTVLGLSCPPGAWENTRFDPAKHSFPEIISRKSS
ncbi:MAG TPA: sugar transferase [Candidatus Saccharimonadales bacterium]|nr:sugar transferase [Candidatus Saccharimonadales bacterium]